MIGILLRYERRLRWLPALTFAALLLGIALLSDAHQNLDGDAALRRATAVLLVLGLAGGVATFALAGPFHTRTLPIEARDLLRARLVEATLLVGLPMLVAVLLLALLSPRGGAYLGSAAGALGVGLLAAHLPLVETVRRERPRAGHCLAMLGLVAAFAAVLWLLPLRASAAAAAWAGTGALVLALLHALALWRMPSASLTLASVAGGQPRVIDHTTPRREVTRAVLGRGVVAMVVAQVLIAVPIGAIDAQVGEAPLLMLVFGFGMVVLQETWRRRQLRLAAWPIANHAGLAPLVGLASLPGLILLLVLGSRSDHALLEANGARASYCEIGDRAQAVLPTPPALRRIGWGEPGPTGERTTPNSRRTMIPGLRLVDHVPSVLLGPIAEVRAQYRACLGQTVADLTGAAPSEAAIDAAARLDSTTLALAFPDHPWRRRAADLFVLACVYFAALFAGVGWAIRPRLYPRRTLRFRVAPMVCYLVLLVLFLSRDLIAIVEHRAAMAILHQPMLAAIPLVAVLALAWRVFARASHAELRPPPADGSLPVRASAFASAFARPLPLLRG